jgi:hypothetical protein
MHKYFFLAKLELLVAFLLATITACVALTVFRLCFDYSLAPYSDPYSIVRNLQNSDFFEFLFTEHNLHRMIWNNLFLWIDYWVFDWDSQIFFFFPLLLVATYPILLWILFDNARLSERIVLVALSYTAYLYPLNWEAIWDPTQSSVIHPLIFFLLLTVIQIRAGLRTERAAPIWLALLFAMGSALSFSYGIAVPYLCVLALCWMRKWLQLAAMAALVALYSFVEIRPQLEDHLLGTQGSSKFSSDQFLLLLKSMTATLGLAAQPFVNAASSIGPVATLSLIGLILLTVAVALLCLLAFRLQFAEIAPWLGLLLVALAGALFIFVMRSSALDQTSFTQNAAASRYFVSSYLAILATIGLCHLAVTHIYLGLRIPAFRLAVASTAVLLAHAFKMAGPEYQIGTQNWMATHTASFMTSLSNNLVPFLELPVDIDIHRDVMIPAKAQGKGPFALPEAKHVGQAVSTLRASGQAVFPLCEGGNVRAVQQFVANHGSIDAVQVLVSFQAPAPRFLGGTVYLSDPSDSRIVATGVTGNAAQDRTDLGRGRYYAQSMILVDGSDLTGITKSTVYYRPSKIGPFCRLPLGGT